MIEVMNNAYAKGCRMLHDKGQPSLVQEVIARRIVEIAKAGERAATACWRILGFSATSK